MYGCHGRHPSSEPDNVLPAPNTLGSPTAIQNVRAIAGADLSHLARAMGGKATVFNVWASWCESCKGELPMMREVAKDYAPKGLHVVLVSVDEAEQFARLPEIVAGYGFSMPVWVAVGPLGEFKWSLAKNWKGNIPVTFLYDSRGQRRFFWDGPVEPGEIRPVIEDMLAGNEVQGEKHFPLSQGAIDESANVP